MPGGLPPGSVAQIAPIMEKVMGQLVKGGGLTNGLSITGEMQCFLAPHFIIVCLYLYLQEGQETNVQRGSCQWPHDCPTLSGKGRATCRHGGQPCAKMR